MDEQVNAKQVEKVVQKKTLIYKKWWFWTIVFVVILLFFSVYGFLNKKDNEEIMRILKYNDYSIYYNYGGNYYGENNKCYDYDYSKEQNCERETNYHDYVTIDIVNNINKDYKFSLIVDYDNEYKITDVSLSYNYQKDEKVSYKYYIDGTKEYFTYSDDTDFYYKIIKYDENSSNFKKVTKSQETQLNSFFNEYKNMLKEIKLSNKELVNCGKWYFETHIKSQIKNSKQKLDKGLTLSEIKDIVENNFTVEKSNDKVILYHNFSLDYIIYYFEEDGGIIMEYGQKYKNDYNDYIVGYLLNEKKYIVMTSDENCLWFVAMEEVKYDHTKVLFDNLGEYRKNCKDDKNRLPSYLYAGVFFRLDAVHLLQEELDKFAIDYFENN